MFYKLILLSFSVFSLITCQSQKTKTTNSSVKNTVKNDTGNPIIVPIKNIASNMKGNTIYLKYGENVFLKAQQMNVTFKAVSQDSRCPEGMNCIWQGAGVAEIELMGTATRPRTIQVATIEMPSKNLHKTSDFNGYRVTLVDFKPIKKSTKMTPSEYLIGLKFEKIDETTTK